MILDAYISTRHIDFIDLRIITDSSEPVIILCNGRKIKRTSPDIKDRYCFYKEIINSLLSSNEYNIEVIQGNNIRIHTKTLKQPEGTFTFRFGVLADLHINSEYCSTEKYQPQRKRLYEKACMLTEKYLKRMSELNAEFVILPGDFVDLGTEKNLKLAGKLLSKSPVPCYPLTGNHEIYGGGNLDAFYSLFEMKRDRYYAFTYKDKRFILLNTPDQSSLDSGTEQLDWLVSELEKYAFKIDTFIFSHFSLILHPCVQGFKNDGMQQFYNYKNILKLLKNYKKLRAFIAGHKNVPSLKKIDNTVHILSPQLIQAPCSYDIYDLYDSGMIRTVYEIDEQDLCFISRNSFTKEQWKERFGEEEQRNIYYSFT